MLGVLAKSFRPDIRDILLISERLLLVADNNKLVRLFNVQVRMSVRHDNSKFQVKLYILNLIWLHPIDKRVTKLDMAAPDRQICH